MLNRTLNTEHQEAARIGVSHRTLQGWRLKKTGPPWIKLGQKSVRYDPALTDQWLAERTHQTA